MKNVGPGNAGPGQSTAILNGSAENANSVNKQRETGLSAAAAAQRLLLPLIITQGSESLHIPQGSRTRRLALAPVGGAPHTNLLPIVAVLPRAGRWRQA